MFPKPPQSEAELLQHAKAIAGKSFAELAELAKVPVPQSLLHGKGWLGQLLERFLGASAGSKAMPDFEYLGIELKTLPLDSQHKPKETTYVSVLPLLDELHLTWEASVVYKKLRRVCWVPVQADPSIPLAERRVGMAALWSPSVEQMQQLQADWEEHMEKVSLGLVETITAHQGQFLQVRPKAADSRAVIEGIGPEGQRIQTLPRGFYLRTVFTARILQDIYGR